MNRISLFKDLARPGFHTSIITTYSVDAAFYDGSLFHRLRTYGCENAILLADRRMLERAIDETPESFSRAGTGYAVIPVAVEECFHPKLHIRLGADGGSLTVGSANATAAGWGGNRELVASFEWWRRREHADNAAVQSLIRKAFDFVLPWVEQADQVSLKRKIDLIERDAPWLFEVTANDAPLALADGTLVDLLLEDANREIGILRRLVDAVGSAPVRRLIIISPYWDGNLSALNGLIDRFRPAETVIALNSRKPQFSVPALRTADAVRFAKIFDGVGADRFIHAKAIIIEADDFDHLLLGSANCSTNALGSFEGPACNAEASMYRRLPAGSAVPSLGVDLGQSIDPSEITAAARERKPPEGPSPPSPGNIEAAGKNIRWRPAAELEELVAGANLKLGETLYPFTRTRADLQLLELAQLPNYPIIARIALPDGRLTSAVLVNDELRLQQAAPGMGNSRLRAALERIEFGDSDLLDLAALATLIFSGPEPVRQKMPRGSAASGDRTDQEVASEGEDYASPEAFRAAMMSKAPARGLDPRLNIGGPDEVSLFRIVMRGMIEGDAASEDIGLGETEPSEGDTPDTSPVPSPDRSAQLPRRVFTGAQIEKRRLDVFRAMKAFEAHLTSLGNSDAAPPRKITAETCFVLRLMVEACRRGMISEKGGEQAEQYALLLAPTATERENTFVIRAGRMLQRLWVGSRSTPALFSRLQIGWHFDELPYDCFAAIVMSRWAAARCVMSVADSRHKDLAAIVVQTAILIWRATASWPQVDAAAELDFVRRLDEALGIASSETDALVDHYRTLTGKLAPPAQVAE